MKIKKPTPPPSALPARTPSSPHDLPPCKSDFTTRWTSQLKMMDRLLALKKAISECFRQKAQNNARELTSHEWIVTNEVCSLLDEISETTIRM